MDGGPKLNYEGGLNNCPDGTSISNRSASLTPPLAISFKSLNFSPCFQHLPFVLAMASTFTPSPTTIKEITMEIPTFVRVYKDATIEHLQNSPIVPPTLEDPITGVSSKDVVIFDNPSISACLYLPKMIQPHEKNHHKVPILVYFHGGGFFFESAFNQLHQNYFHLFVSKAHVLVVSVEYKLAPETPLPAAYEDCWESFKWVATKPSHG